jgi:hypothetical protein
MEEIWKDIEGYEGLYQVSNLGNVKRLAGKWVKKERLIKFKIDRYGYPSYSLSKNKVLKSKTAHRLVAKAFVPNLLNKPAVNHINGIKTDNKVENLEWCTNKENTAHSIEIGLQDQKGVKHHKCKLTEEQVLEIRKIAYSETRTALSKKYSVSRAHILRLIKNEGWEHI